MITGATEGTAGHGPPRRIDGWGGICRGALHDEDLDRSRASATRTRTNAKVEGRATPVKRFHRPRLEKFVRFAAGYPPGCPTWLEPLLARYFSDLVIEPRGAWHSFSPCARPLCSRSRPAWWSASRRPQFTPVAGSSATTPAGSRCRSTRPARTSCSSATANRSRPTSEFSTRAMPSSSPGWYRSSRCPRSRLARRRCSSRSARRRHLSGSPKVTICATNRTMTKSAKRAPAAKTVAHPSCSTRPPLARSKSPCCKAAAQTRSSTSSMPTAMRKIPRPSRSCRSTSMKASCSSPSS